MYDEKAGMPRSVQRLQPGSPISSSPRQKRLMLAALLLLLVSLAFVLYRDRDFWFPDTEEADDRPLLAPETQSTAPAVAAPAVAVPAVTAPAVTAPAAAAPVDTRVPSKKKRRVHELAPRIDSQAKSDAASAGPTVTATRTVLPPLEVEVVAGDAHRTLRPGTNSVHVDLQHAPSGLNSAPPPDEATQTSSRGMTPAAQRTSFSPNAADIVTRSVQPDYPRLARQMRVQGSVVLQALIGRDGLIEDLHVLSGPSILANAAEEAVRQWHFKPHFVGTLPVETRANITVNFTISTN